MLIGRVAELSGASCLVVQPMARLTQEPETLVRYSVRPHAFIYSSADSRRAVVSYWQKYVHAVLVNHLGGLSLPRKSVVWLTDCPDMTIVVYYERKTQQQQEQHRRIPASNISPSFKPMDIPGSQFKL